MFRAQRTLITFPFNVTTFICTYTHRKTEKIRNVSSYRNVPRNCGENSSRHKSRFVAPFTVFLSLSLSPSLQFCCIPIFCDASLAKVIRATSLQLEFYEISSVSGAKFKCILLERSRRAPSFADLHNYTLQRGVTLEVAKKKRM